MSPELALHGRACFVLAVDDDDMVLIIIARSLRRLGCEVSTCSSAADALECLEERSFDVLLLDVRMPGMSGVELFRVIQKRWPDLAQRTGFVTGNIPSNETEALLDQTGLPILLKPFDMVELEAFVRKLSGFADEDGVL
jgi:DNA-binding response OmpR family regulator